ncbi:peptidylprolyl isomerase [Candidatus Woesearchaeota archaeon]|nr:peptidylprolyl isomerase [Candidatus Woesearchaeota archaeon]
MEEKKENSDEVLIDFSQLAEKLKKMKLKFFKKTTDQYAHSPQSSTHASMHLTESHHEKKHQEKSHYQENKREENKKNEETIDIKKSFSETSHWIKNNSKWLIPLICILVAVFASVYLRTMPLRMPITDGWAENTVQNYYQNQLQQQINQQYPNLPEQNRNALLAKEWEKFLQDNQQQMDQQKKQLSEQYKSQFRDEDGTTYLLGIDPYHYYRQTSLVLENGFPGTEIKDGKLLDSYRMAPIGDLAEWNFHHWFAAYWHRFLNLFGNYPLMFTFFLVGTFFSALTVIPAFFIGRIVTKNNAGGFFTAMLIAVSSFFVARTTGESSDTDVYAVFFPVLITWLFLEAMERKKLKQKLVWIGLAGFATGVFAFAWTGWWYSATFITITLVTYGLVQLILNIKQISQTIKSMPFLDNLYLFLGYTVSSSIFVSIFASFAEIMRVLRGPFQFLKLKAVAVNSYWPNIRTTVAELNVPSFANVIEQFDGKLFFVLAILGILLTLTLVKRNKQEEKEENKWNIHTWDFRIPFFFAMWFAAASFATTKGIRFILQLTPAFAFGFGAFLGITWLFSSRWISKELKVPPVVSKILIFIVLSLLLISPAKSGYSQAYNSAPSISDGWYNALTKIKTEATQTSVITSWWDFGHWFKAIAERPVTFDGGNQVGYGAHWVGKSLITNDEKVTTGIVRMLNCGQNNAFTELNNFLDNDTLKGIDLLNTIILQDKPTAIKTLAAQGLSAKQIAQVIQYTHCDAPTDYFITSEDMVGKSGVWGHFGSWDFKKAVMYLETKKLSLQEGEKYLAKKFNLSPDEANNIYSEIQSTDADKWIAPWPSFLSGSDSCNRLSDEELRCVSGVQGSTFALRVNTKTWNVSFENNPEVVPNSIVYADREGVKEKQLEGKRTGFSVMLIPKGDEYILRLADPLQAAGTFSKLFFFEGHGMKCFQKFNDASASGTGRIITWIVDYSCQQENKVFFLPKEEVHASHILVSLQNRSDEEALALIKEIQTGLTAANFGVRAAKYSEDTGSQQNGGDLGWFGKGVMVPEFEQAAFSLKKGEISQPIKTQFGYHLIFLTEKREN